MIASTTDALATKVFDKPQTSSTLVEALSKQKPKYASTLEIVERVKLISSAVLKSTSTEVIGTFAPVLLNLILFSALLEQTKLHQKRLLIDLAFQVVDAVDSVDLEKYVLMGAWEKIASSQVLQRALDTVCEENKALDKKKFVEGAKLFVLLLLQLQTKIAQIDKRASQMATDRVTESAELKETTKEFVSCFKEEVIDK